MKLDSLASFAIPFHASYMAIFYTYELPVNFLTSQIQQDTLQAFDTSHIIIF